MNLADAFSQVTCSDGEAQVILTSLISNLRDSYPDLYTSMSAEIANITETVDPPVARTATTAKPSTSTT
jgi:hypothetical protein